MVQQPAPRTLPQPAFKRIPTAVDREFARTVPTAVEAIHALAEGELFGLTVSGTCMTPAGVFDDDLAVLRRHDHAEPGQIVAAHYRHQRLGLPWLALKHYHPDGLRVRLVPADPAVAPVELDHDQVAILGVLVGIDGTVRLPAQAELACVVHQRLLRPEACTACQVLACGRAPITVAARTGLRPDRATATAAAGPDGPFGLVPPLARLLDRLAQQLLDQLNDADGKPTLVIALDDLGERTDPIDVYHALLQGAGAFAQNQQLRAYLDRLSGEHAVTALTAALMWELLGTAGRALEHYPDLSEGERELVRALERVRELSASPIASVPEIGIELLAELEAAREYIAAAEALQEARRVAIRSRSAAASSFSPERARSTAGWSPATSTRPSAAEPNHLTSPLPRGARATREKGIPR